MMTYFFLGVTLLASNSLFGGNHAMDQGSIKFGGKANLCISKDSDEKRLEIGGYACKHACYFVRPGLCVGGAVRPSFELNHWTECGLSLGPAVYYYFGENEQQMYPFVGFNPYFEIYRQQNVASYTYFDFGFYLRAGIAWMITDDIAIEPEIYYNYNRSRISNEGTYRYSTNKIGLDVGFAKFKF